MAGQVEIGAGVDAFHFLEAKGHLKLDIGSRIGVMSQFVVVMKAVLVVTQAQGLVPFEAGFLPLSEPIEFSTRFDKKLHLHLLEFTHAENKLTGHDFVAEGFSNLGYTEG